MTLEPPNGFKLWTVDWESSAITIWPLLQLQYVILFSQFCWFQNSLTDLLHTVTLKGSNFITKLKLFCLKHRIWVFRSSETTQFSQNVFYWLQHFFSSYGYLFEVILQDVSWGFDIYHLTFGDKSLRVYLPVSNKVLKTLKALICFQVFKRSLSD